MKSDLAHAMLKAFSRYGPIILGIVITFALKNFGVFAGGETASIDADIALREPRLLKNTHLVVIGPAEYREIFCSSSPLAPQKVVTLIAAIASGGAKAIVVDLDTSSEAYAPLQGAIPRSVPIVWARDARLRTQPRDDQSWIAKSPDFLVEPAAVLGGDRDPMTPWSFGLATITGEANGFRTYRRQLAGGNTTYDSLPFATLRSACRRDTSFPGCAALTNCVASSGCLDPVFVRYSGTSTIMPKLPASELLRLAGNKSWADGSPLKGKIVILGGTYPEARDTYLAPSGRVMAGAEILLEVIEAELVGDIRSRPGFWLTSLAELMGLATVVAIARGILRRYPRKRIRAVGVFVSSLLLAIGISWWLWGTPVMFGSFMPIMLLAFLDEEHSLAIEKLTSPHPQSPTPPNSAGP